MASYHVECSIHVKAQPEKVFEIVADFNTWSRWSPWLCCDRAATVTVSENSNSVNATYHWKGEVVGEGEILHVKLDYGKRIEDKLTFIKPFKSVNKVWFDFLPETDGTKVVWHMQGNLPWFLFWMKSSIQTFISMDFDRGLRMLAELVEQGAVATDTVVGNVETVGPYSILGVEASCEFRDIGPSMDKAFEKLQHEMQAAGVLTSGEMISVYHKFDMKTGKVNYLAGFSVSPGTKPGQNLTAYQIPSTKALAVRHTGSYDHLGNAWSAANANLRSKKLKQSKTCGGFEIYRNTPENTATQDLITDVYLPLK